MKKIVIGIAALSALALAFIGADSMACGGKCAKTSNSAVMSANAVETCPVSGVKCAGSGNCSTIKNSNLPGGCSSHKCGNMNSDWTSKVCGDRGYYGANVFGECHGHEYAIYDGKTFEVTEDTPFIQVKNARYYFPNENAASDCEKNMSSSATRMEQQAVSLATADGNVIDVNGNGQKTARCPVTGKTFVVTADSPVKVIDGRKYYLNAGTELSTVSSSIHQ